MNGSGTCTAMITPFLNDQLDEEGLAYLIQRQLAAGVEGLLFLGTTGEAATLTEEERRRVLACGVAKAKGKATLFVGTGSNATQQTVARTREAEALGADIALVVTPYYNKPTQEGIYRHFDYLVERTDIPIMIYNVPSRTGVSIEPETLLRLAALPHIIGIKEASGNLVQASESLLHLTTHYPDFTFLSGDDGLTLPLMALGAKGIISVISNLFPKLVVDLVQSMQQGELSRARKLHEQLLPFIKVAFIETNPVPIKEALTLSGLPAGGCRLPLCALRSDHHAQLRSVLEVMQATLGGIR